MNVKKFFQGFLIILCFSSSTVLYSQDFSGGFDLNSFFAEAAKSYEWIFSLKAPIVSKQLKFGDSFIEIEFVPMHEKQLEGPYTLSFWFTNKTAKPIQINWEATKLISINGKTRKLIHGDMRSVSFSAQENTVVAPGEKIGDAVTPRETIITDHHEAHWDENGNWIEAWDEITDFSLFCGDDYTSEGYENVKKEVVGKEMKLSLSLIVNGAPKVYDFIFKIDDITLTQAQ